MTEAGTHPEAPSTGGGVRWGPILLTVLITVIVTVGLTYWVLSRYVFLKEFEPVTLNAREERVLEGKLRTIGYEPAPRAGDPAASTEFDDQGYLKPEPYSELGASREVSFTERELNALLANNTDLARKLAIDLSDNLMSAKLLVPLEPDFPMLGGKTLRVNAGMELAYEAGRPIVVLKGVSVMGVPIPNAWLGNLKNVDLVGEFGTDPGFWQSFSKGVEHVQVDEGRLNIKLKE